MNYFLCNQWNSLILTIYVRIQWNIIHLIDYWWFSLISNEFCFVSMKSDQSKNNSIKSSWICFTFSNSLHSLIITFPLSCWMKSHDIFLISLRRIKNDDNFIFDQILFIFNQFACFIIFLHLLNFINNHSPFDETFCLQMNIDLILQSMTINCLPFYNWNQLEISSSCSHSHLFIISFSNFSNDVVVVCVVSFPPFQVFSSLFTPFSVFLSSSFCLFTLFSCSLSLFLTFPSIFFFCKKFP